MKLALCLSLQSVVARLWAASTRHVILEAEGATASLTTRATGAMNVHPSNTGK